MRQTAGRRNAPRGYGEFMADEPTTPTPNIDTGYTDAGVPTLDGVRDKIETRYGTALGATELAEETPEVRTAAAVSYTHLTLPTTPYV